MFVNEVNDVKIYNLSAGKSVPDWLTDRRKRSKLLKKVDSRRQIELIQEFEMPGVCSTIRMSPDQQYILATGTYKPRVKCFEVSNLSLKFERCFDSEVTTFEILSDDYSKMVFLHCDRYVEIHSAHGRHYRLRIPRFGRDMKYHKPSCDLLIVGTTKEIYRLNLERGQFLQPYETNGSCINACAVSSEHHLVMAGSKEGMVEAWDPRTKSRCATLDVAIKLPGTKEFPSISALSFKNGLHMGVGTASGHVLLYDIRSREPLLLKDHLNQLPVKRIAFNVPHQTVYSLDDAMLKLWDEQTGKQVAYIESSTTFNDFCTIPETGMFFLAQEDVKMLTYYIPAMGPAPRWCSFLDNLTEEIESEVVENVYDDYQFVTQKELDTLGLDHLVGTNLLKAYMHGHFVDVRLYNKAKSAVDPFAFDRYRKEKVRKELENERQSRLQLSGATKLPKVNQDLALKILEEEQSGASNTRNPVPSLLKDNRFKAMFEKEDFAINKNAEEYKLLAPVLNRLEKSKSKTLKKRIEVSMVEQLHDDEEHPREDSDNDEDLFGFNTKDHNESDSNEAESSDEENARAFSKEMKKAYKDVKRQRDEDENDDNDADQPVESKDVVPQMGHGNLYKSNTSSNRLHNEETMENNSKRKFKMQSLDASYELDAQRSRIMKVSLQQRVQKLEESTANVTTIGRSASNRQMTFDVRKPPTREMKKRDFEMRKHHDERRRLVRPIKSLKLKKVNYK